MTRLTTILLFIVFLTGAFSGFAQKRNISKIAVKHDTIKLSGYTNDAELIAINKVYNTTNNTVNYRWVVVSANLNPAWNYAICDVNNCYSNTDSQEFSLNGKDSGLFDINFYPNNTAGTGNVLIYIYPIGEYTNGIYFYAKATVSTSGGISNNIKIDFNMFPNPVKDYLEIRFTKKGTHAIEVYNILGRRIASKEVYNTDRMRLSFENLQNGMYVIMYRTENGKVITKTISKE